MTEAISRQRIAGRRESPALPLAADPDGRVRLPRFVLDDVQFTDGAVVCVQEISFDGGRSWRELGRDEIEAGAKARDGSSPSIAHTMTIWDDDDQIVAPTHCRYSLERLRGAPVCGARVEGRRNFQALPRARHHSPTLVQSDIKNANGVNNTTLAYPSNNTAGNILQSAMAHYNTSGQGISINTDTLGNTWAGWAATLAFDFNVRSRGQYAANCAAGANTVTFDTGGTVTGDIVCAVAEFSGVTTSSPLHAAAGGNTSAGTTLSTSNFDAGAVGHLVCGFCIHSGADTTITEEGDWSLIEESESGSSGMPLSFIWKVASSTTENHTWTFGASRSGSWQLASFIATAVPTSLPVKTRRSTHAMLVR